VALTDGERECRITCEDVKRRVDYVSLLGQCVDAFLIAPNNL